MKIRLEAETVAELDRAEAAARRVFGVGEVSRDYRNRPRTGAVDEVLDYRRYLRNVTVLDDVSPAAMLFGYRKGSGARPSTVQLADARRLLAGEMWTDRPVPVTAIEIAEEIVAVWESGSVVTDAIVQSGPFAGRRVIVRGCPSCGSATREGEISGRRAVDAGDGPEWCDNEWHDGEQA